MKSACRPSRPARAWISGMTLVELLTATAVFVVGLGAALITFVGVQRSFATSLYQITAQNDQNRVFAYLRRDLREASTVQISAQNTQLTLTVSTGTTPSFNLNLGLSLLSLLGPPTTPSATETIQWYRQGTSIIREVNGVPTTLSSSATEFEVYMNGTLVEIDAAFQPRYSILGQTTVTAATSVSAYVHLLNAGGQ